MCCYNTIVALGAAVDDESADREDRSVCSCCRSPRAKPGHQRGVADVKEPVWQIHVIIFISTWEAIGLPELMCYSYGIKKLYQS